jgi:hypothetical protein
MKDKDSQNFEPSCGLAQQLTGTLFGFIFGFTLQNLIGNSILVIFIISVGTSFGLIGSQIPNPCQIKFIDWLKWCLISLLISIPFSSLVYFGIAGIFFLAFIQSILTSYIKLYFDIFSDNNEVSTINTSGLNNKPICEINSKPYHLKHFDVSFQRV